MIVKMNDMEIGFKRLHENARIPQKAYNDDYGFDCVAVTEEEIRETDRGSNGYGSTGLKGM